MTKFMLKLVYLNLTVLSLYRCCIYLVSQFNWPIMLRVFNIKVKNLAFDTSINSYHKCMVFYEELMQEPDITCNLDASSKYYSLNTKALTSV